MSTTPNLTPVVSQPGFLKRHETTIVIILALGVLIWLGNKWLNNAAAQADAKLQAAKTTLTQQQQQNQQLAQQVSQATQQYNTLATQLAAQNQQLLATIAQRGQATTVQQQRDQALPLTDLGTRWHSLIPEGTITSTPSGLLADDPASRATVSQLEEVPTLTATIQDQTTLITNNNAQIGKLDLLSQDQSKEITGLQTQVKDTGTMFNAKLSAQAANARRRERNWAIAGAIAGTALGVFIGHKAQ